MEDVNVICIQTLKFLKFLEKGEKCKITYDVSNFNY